MVPAKLHRLFFVGAGSPANGCRLLNQPRRGG